MNEIEQILYDVAYQVAIDYQNELRNFDSIASGALNNVDFEVEIKGGTYKIYLILQDYWKYVEYGRKPGKFPNIGAIQKWIEIKPIIPKPYKGKIPTPKQLSSIISRSIKKKGIPAKNVLNNTLNEVMKVQTDKIKKAIGNDYELQVGIMIQEELNSKNIKTKIT